MDEIEIDDDEDKQSGFFSSFVRMGGRARERARLRRVT